MAVTVYILTTKGPVRIQRISEEEPGVQSVICLDGRAQALPISSRYDAFVRNPTGVVERVTGHGAYRMDVDQMIDDGDSWQLGAYLSHLSEQITGEDVYVFATGEVDRDLNVRPVTHVPEKLEQAGDLLRALNEDGKSIRVFVPQLDGMQQIDCSGVRVDTVTHVDQVFDLFGMAPPKPLVSTIAARPHQALDKTTIQRTLIWVSPILLIVGWFLWAPLNWVGLANQGKLLELEQALIESGGAFIGDSQRGVFFLIQKIRLPDRAMPQLIGKMKTAAKHQDCDTNAVSKVVPWDTSVADVDDICELIVQAQKKSNDEIIVGRMGYWPEGLGKGGKPERTMRGSAGAANHRWTLTFEKFPNKTSVVRLVILMGLAPPSGSQPWYAVLLREPIDSADFADAKARVERLGYHVFVHDWQRP